MTKLDQLRALREQREGARRAKASVRSKNRPSSPLPDITATVDTPTPEQAATVKAAMETIKAGCCPTCGRFWVKGTGTFDKRAYQRSYMAKRRASQKST